MGRRNKTLRRMRRRQPRKRDNDRVTARKCSGASPLLVEHLSEQREHAQPTAPALPND
jgi:hypothetical protein